MKADKYIFENLINSSFSLKNWLRRNIIGVLGTLIVHVLFFIILLIIKIQSFNEIRELGITLEFPEEDEENINQDQKQNLTADELNYLNELLAKISRESNLASNVAEILENKISTKNYIEQVEKELELSRSEDWKKMKEDIQTRLNKQDFYIEDNDTETDSSTSNFSGLTNITYEFLEPPYQRFKVYLPVPVYKCRGEGIVTVDITVGQNGRVITARANARENYQDADCMEQIAEKYALITRFEGNLNAPKDQKARITFNFIAQ